MQERLAACARDHALPMRAQTLFGIEVVRDRSSAQAPVLARHDVCFSAAVNTMSLRRKHMNPPVDINEICLTVAEVAERLKVNEETVRRLFLNEPVAPWRILFAP